MSFFLGDTAQYTHVGVDEEKIKLAKIQFDAISTTFNKVLQVCQGKCIAHEYGEGDLNTGEASCIDRCVAKFVKANAMIGQDVQSSLIPNRMPEYDVVLKQLNKNSSNNYSVQRLRQI